MRYFNTHGPVEEDKHYVVQRQPLIDKLTDQIEQGKYFTIFAPRQMGKTTLLRNLAVEMQARPNYIVIPVSFERFETWSVEDFLAEFWNLIFYHSEESLRNHPAFPQIQTLLAQPLPTGYRAFEHFFRQLYRLIPECKVVLIIDEFDAMPTEALSPLLQTWRSMYLNKLPPHSLHSVVLIGIQNIAKLNFGRSSPFNIAYQQRLDEFSLDEVRNLLDQYTAETGQPFATGVIEKIYEQTGGQPFLVNRLATILTSTVVPQRDRPLTQEDLRIALRHLVKETNYNFETLTRHATAFEKDVVRILFGAEIEFTLNNPLVKDLHLFGIVSETKEGNCAIANPIYKRVLMDYFRPPELGLQGAILANGYDFRPHVVNGELQMSAILRRFGEFIERRGREAFKVTPMPQEATGQYLLMAYLDLVMRQIGGDLFTEVNSGEGRIDLLVSHLGRRYVVETKIWRGQVEYERGLTQLCTYLDSENQQSGYYVLFHARPEVYGKLTRPELEFTVEEAGKQINVFLIRLGQLFDSKEPSS